MKQNMKAIADSLTHNTELRRDLQEKIMMNEKQAIELVKLKKLRIVSPARKRKLRKKGVSVRWIAVLNAYAWEPNW